MFAGTKVLRILLLHNQENISLVTINVSWYLLISFDVKNRFTTQILQAPRSEVAALAPLQVNGTRKGKGWGVSVSDEKALSFLRDASDVTLQQYELNKRAESADLLRQVRAIFFEACRALADAETARKWREHRSALAAGTTAEGVVASFPSVNAQLCKPPDNLGK